MRSEERYHGTMQFMVVQLLGLILIIAFPMIGLSLPAVFDAVR